MTGGRLSLRRRVLLAFALMALGHFAAIGAGLWLAYTRAPDALPVLVLSALVAGFWSVLVTLLAWRIFDERGARPITRLAAALRARAHGRLRHGLDTTETAHLGDLGPAAAALCAESGSLRDRFDARVEDAVQAAMTDNAHLAHLLSEIPAAVMIVDARNRILLYDRQCVHALGHVAPLGLGRPVFDYLARAALERALAHVAGAQRFAETVLPFADGSGSLRARIIPALQGRGFLLMMEVEDSVMAERPLVFDFGLIDHPPARAIAETPLAALDCVVFDTETTGLDTTRDDIVQIGAVRVVNGRIVAGESFETLVDPGRPIPPASSRIHGITDDQVRGAPRIGRALSDFHAFAAGAVLVAHNAPFDLAFLRRHKDRTGLAFDHPVLDTVLLSAEVFGITESHTLDAIANRLGVAIDGSLRHTATGDARVTAEVLLRLLPILRAHGIDTFGDAATAMRRHARLLPDANPRLPDAAKRAAATENPPKP